MSQKSPEWFDFYDRLLRIPSVSDNVPAVNAAVDAMREYLSSHGVHCAVEELDGRRVLYASTCPGKVQDYLLNAHLDVVPAPARLFEPRMEDGVIRGRGVADCKGNAIVIARVLIDLAARGGASVGAVFTSDEEIGGETTRYMVEKGYGARRMVIILDASPYAIANAQKGTAYLTLRARGRGGHSSIPWDLDNPIEKLTAAYGRLCAAWPAPTEDRWCDTLTATVVRAGEVPNQIPDVAEMTLNLRYTAPEGLERARDFIASTTGLEVDLDHACVPVFCDEKHPEMRRLFSRMQEHWPDRGVHFYRMNGATDSRHFVATGTPIAILGVDGGDMHCDGEWLRLASLDDYVEFLEEFMAPA